MKRLIPVKAVDKESLAASWGIAPGDFLVAVNDVEIGDIFDYYYQTEGSFVTVTVQRQDGEIETFSGEKAPEEDIGLVFEEGLLDEYRSCSNSCIFCFIDQMPPGMRDTLYFKDDDTRLSFLQGNYVTLTNMKDRDFERIIDYRLTPINVSVHATNPSLRERMLNNRFAGNIMEQLGRLAEAGIKMNAQIVLCKGVNDGAELDRTIEDLSSLIPHMNSLSVVPVGLTRFRDGLPELLPFDGRDALEVIGQVERWQSRIWDTHKTHFVHASDEWYLLCGRDFPEEERYDGYPQLENGVGMMRLLMEEFTEALTNERRHPFVRGRCTIATGFLAAPTLQRLCGELTKKYRKVTAKVVPIRNDFFGEKITVSGLLTGQDLLSQLKDRDLGDRLLLPVNMLRSGENVFLDDMTLDELSEALHIPVVIVKSSGLSLVRALLGLRQE